MQGSAEVDHQHEPTGATPLMCACAQGRIELAKLLLKYHADLILLDRYEHSAIHYAIWGGSAKCVKLVLSRAGAGQLQTAKDIWGKTAFLVATSKVR